MAVRLDKNKEYAGEFLIEEDSWAADWVPGSLMLGGRDTCLQVYDDTPRLVFDDTAHRLSGPHNIKGRLYDGVQVMLVECYYLNPPHLALQLSPDRRISRRFVPRYVLAGQLPYEISEPFISGVQFSIDDTAALFTDPEAFFYANDSDVAGDHEGKPDVSALLDSLISGVQRDDRWQKKPVIAVYTGKYEVFSIDTSAGHISARHQLDRPNDMEFFDLHLQHDVQIEVDFGCSLDFKEAVRRTKQVQQFLEVVIGRLQTLTSWQLVVPDNRTVTVYETLNAEIRREGSWGTPYYLAVLIQAARSPDYFATVLKNWIRREAEWKPARHLAYRYYGKRGPSDDLITAATTFEYLPYPEDIAASSAEEKAMIECLRETAKKQDVNKIVRDRSLTCIGHIKHRSLGQKIRYWVGNLSPCLCAELPHFQEVADEAVRWRNHLVHGSQQKNDDTDYTNLDMLVFLTQTLQFLFVVSDLLKSGWQVEEWLANRGGTPHPLAIFLLNYQNRVEELKRVSSNFRRQVEKKCQT